MSESTRHLVGLDRAALTPVIRRLIGSPTAEVADWSATAVTTGSTMAAGVYRLTGTARAGVVAAPWSVILKQVAVGADPVDLNPTSASYWRREPLVFTSGLLDGLDGGLAAPRCLGIEERSDATWLWLEDVAEEPGTAWPIARYGLAARHLGGFAGASREQRPLDPPWLTRGLIRERVASRRDAVARLAAARDRPLVRRYWTDAMIDGLARLAEASPVLLDTLDRLPRVLQHGDAGRKNLFARRRGGREETVAIDWAWLGLGALGEDAATLAASSILWFHVDEADAEALEQACFAGYVEGLRVARWRGDPELVRLGMTTALALRFAFVPIVELVPPDQWPTIAAAFGRPFEDACERVAFVRRFALDRADQARALLERR